MSGILDTGRVRERIDYENVEDENNERNTSSDEPKTNTQ